MKNAEKLALILAYEAELARQTAEGSTASHAKKADLSVRDFLMAHGIGSTDDIRCRPGSRYDWELYVRRVHIVGETKVGSGAVRYANTCAELSYNPDDIYPNVDYIAYCAESDKLKAHPEKMSTLFRVFTREQFIEVLTATGRKGLESSLRIHQTKSGTWQLEIQPWKTKATAARLGKYEDWVKANGIPTLEEFRKVLRG